MNDIITTGEGGIVVTWHDITDRILVSEALREAIDHAGHIRTDGSTVPAGKSQSAALYLEVDYSFTHMYYGGGILFEILRHQHTGKHGRHGINLILSGIFKKKRRIK